MLSTLDIQVISSIIDKKIKIKRLAYYLLNLLFKMKLAIPIFGNRVSPRFDCAGQILIVELEDKQVVSCQRIDKKAWLPYSDASRMKALGIDTVICGGIRHWDLFGLNGQGISVIPQIFGEVEEIIRLFLEGNLNINQSMTKRNKRRFRCRCAVKHLKTGKAPLKK